MSPPNNNYPPAFDFSVNESFFGSQSSEVPNTSFPQWTPQDPRTVGSIPSPSTSVRTAMTAPNPTTSHRTSIAQPPLVQQDNRINPSLPNLPFLQVPAPARSRSAMESASNVDPVLSRVYGAYHDEPWSTVRMRNSSFPTGRSSFSQSNMNYGTYREGSGSDLESVAPRSDSGYYTHQAQSVISNEPGRVDRELPPEMTYQVGNINVNSTSSEATEVFHMQSDQASQYSGHSMSHSKGTFKCPKCKEVSKCPSDYKKHMLKHEKPYRCDVSGCRRAAAGKGFTTINDLTRHKKSVHRIGVEKDSYQCASENCRNRGKIWPRLDNFKQHITRMHKGEDEQDLIRRSAYRGPYPAPTGDALSVAPIETSLAGIGTEKQFAGNELDDPISGISLTPDQDSSHWTSFDPSSQEFAMDVDRTNVNANSHVSRNTSNGSGHGFPRHPNGSISTSTPEKGRPQDSLNVLADVASTQAAPNKRGPTSLRQLSSAPQTKAEQQRQALQKFSRIIVDEIQNAPSADSVDLENVVLRVLYGASKQGRKESIADNPAQGSSLERPATEDSGFEIVMTKSEALKASQAISNIIKQSANPPFTSRPRRPSKVLSSNIIQCQQCGTTLSRSCDMKKHMKRHTKPYGCTYPKCYKRFGAKSDWKRHENSQHFQLESFRCQETDPSSQTPCGELFYRVEMFKNHLRSEHKMTQPDQLARELKARRIGRNGQGQFWCGFCERIVPLKAKRSAAWDERFDHIDHHFNKEKRSIEDWLCVEAKKKKGEVLRQMDRRNFDGEVMDDYGVGETDESPPASGEDRDDEPVQAPMPSIQAHVPVPVAAASQATSGNSRKRQAPIDAAVPPAPKRRRDIDRYCCSCQHGPWPTNMYVDCVACGHHLCSNCTVVGGAMGLEGSMILG